MKQEQAISFWESRLPEFKNLGESSNSEDLQRTEQWYKDRGGVFTGSEITKLMSCGRSSAKMEWGRAEKMIDLGKGAIKYIYSKAKEREKGKIIKMGDVFQFKYGKKTEQPILELFLEKRPDLIYQKHGLEKYNDHLGASPDGSFIDKETGEVLGGEMKAAMNFETFYERAEVVFDQSHMDFWQVQTEMLCLKGDKLFYVTGEPVEDAANVVYGDMTNDEIKEAIGEVNIQLIHASEIHQNAIINRAKLGDEIIKEYLKGTKFTKAVIKCCSEFEIINQ